MTKLIGAEIVWLANPKIFYCMALYRKGLPTPDLESLFVLLFVYVFQGFFLCWGGGNVSASHS